MPSVDHQLILNSYLCFSPTGASASKWVQALVSSGEWTAPPPVMSRSSSCFRSMWKPVRQMRAPANGGSRCFCLGTCEWFGCKALKLNGVACTCL